MKSLYCYKILHDLKITIQLHQGTVEAQPLLALKKKLLEDPDFDPSYPLILDFRKAEMAMSVKETMLYRDTLEIMYHAKNFPRSKCATLTNTPLTTAMTMHFSENPMVDKVHYHTFSSMDTAIQWLGLKPELANPIEEHIRQLLQNPPDPNNKS